MTGCPLCTAKQILILTYLFLEITTRRTLNNNVKLTTGDHPEALWCTCSPRAPRTLGWEGPHISISKTATYKKNTKECYTCNPVAWDLVITYNYTALYLVLWKRILCMTDWRLSCTEQVINKEETVETDSTYIDTLIQRHFHCMSLFFKLQPDWTIPAMYIENHLDVLGLGKRVSNNAIVFMLFNNSSLIFF